MKILFMVCMVWVMSFSLYTGLRSVSKYLCDAVCMEEVEVDNGESRL